MGEHEWPPRIYFAHLHLDLLIAALPLCISSYRFELWVPFERHWLAMHIMIWSLNGALPLYNTIIAYVLHELSKVQFSMLLTYCAPALVFVLHIAYIVSLHHVYPWTAKMSKNNFKKISFYVFTKRTILSHNFNVVWKFIPNAGDSFRESTLALVQFSCANIKLLWGRWSELPGDVRKVQETSKIRWLMYCKSAICKSGQFEFDCK